MRASSSGAFCSTCCPRASTAFAITAFSPAPAARRTSCAPAPCSPRRSLRRTAVAQTMPMPPRRRTRGRACPCCGGRMIVIETFARGHPCPRAALDANAMSSNHPTGLQRCRGAHHRRPDRCVQQSSRASVIQVATLKSSALRRPHRNRRGLHAPRPPAEDFRPTRQTRLSGHSGPGGTVKSP